MIAYGSAPLIEGLLEAVCVVDAATLKVLYANQAATVLLALERSSLVGRPATEVFDTLEDTAFWKDTLEGTAQPIRSMSRLVRADGTVLHVERCIESAEWSPHGPVWVVGMVDRTQQRKAEDELETLIAELRATLESTADGILVCGLDGAMRAFNRRFAQMWEIPKSMLMQRDDAAMHALLAAQVDDSARYLQRLADINASIASEATDMLLLRSGRLLQRTVLPQFSRGRIIGRVFSFHDITERAAAEKGLRLAAKVFESCPDAVFITDAHHRVVSVNPACCKLTRHEHEVLVGLSAIDLFEERDAGRLFTEVQKSWQASGFWEGEVWHRRGDGSNCPVRLSWVVLRGPAGEVVQTIGFFRDLSGQRAAQQRIEDLAYSDVLTGLPNRLLLSRRVDRVLQLHCDAPAPFAVLFVDLDRFKNINDSLGHQFGDRVLVKVADRIKSCLRLADTLARLGGDEFVIHLHNADAPSAEVVARRIIEALAQPFMLDDMRFSVSCSIGVALYPQDGQTLDDLVRHADTAMFRVKEHGRGSYRFYQPQMNANLLARMQMDHAMRQALEHQRFRLHYQPQIDMRTGELVGVEALIRWTDPELGSVSPGVFIPLAEESGFIIAIGAWVLEEAVRQGALWQQAGTPVPVSVNVSALQFRQPDFVERVATAIRVSGLDAKLLELELTESILVQGADEAVLRLDALAKLGVRLAIDDFGTGYSSLAYLKKFPIHRLKIDQSFVRGLPDDESDRAIVTAMISMGHALRFEMVAEGVETHAQRDCLHALHCNLFQGYLCAPGMPAEDLTVRMQAQPFMPPRG
ncbi:sensor domain-containing protein [Xylophilus ampelinus]|uniref:Diguanylate cyclase/phosphodiesterase with PAS/PAC sensor(S) n=1 Tax=Xylophilus ampelinus TaxID=54067 RepID=A0A318SUY1_9BURK|nr:bifunctional diguanylate cyclase/phosphodiesterase [Xylophilus ampelinus]MCS4509916.1 EAL domain-containing protein [Xylophilus ampelinus]PYE78534.1 diguanylate cyclase/phosphodiesterase with PAS/PAC sensor(s) [Xylophilus ampelinus]